MNILQRCEEDAIKYFKEQQGIDISTKEKRVALPEKDKRAIFNFLVNQFMMYSFAF